jgi:predicted TIM-barrel fold metal-dependent hydrolase
MRYQTALRSDRGEAFISEATPPQSSIRHAHLATSTSPLKSSTKWAVAVMPLLAEGLPADHPSLDPIWREAQEYDLPIANHNLTWTPPYCPGYRVLYDNIFLGRLAAHPWGAMRFAAAFLGGRFFCGIEHHEGQDMFQDVTQFLGDDLLMYASDYPHSECQFPDSVSNIME